jgi:hypothetical protein
MVNQLTTCDIKTRAIQTGDVTHYIIEYKLAGQSTFTQFVDNEENPAQYDIEILATRIMRRFQQLNQNILFTEV